MENFFEKYNEKVIAAINDKMKKNHITQKELSRLSKISQSTLSKLLSNKAQFTLEQIVKICIALQVDIKEIISFKNMGISFDENIYSTNFIAESDNFVCDTKRPAFKGYIGNKYYIYFHSTVSTETKIINGELSFYNSEDDRCKIKLEIYTGKIDVFGNKITKKYTGDMIISIPLSSCYCILINQEIGEMCFITFHHMFLFSQDMICRMGAALTTSSGGNRRPTIHRMIISKYEYDLSEDSDDLKFIKGQLKLNGSKIIISKSAFEQLLEQAEVKQSEELQKFFEKFKSLSATEEHYVIDEAKLLDSSVDVITKVQGISLLREASVAKKNNKISSKTDEFIFQYITNKNRDEV